MCFSYPGIFYPTVLLVHFYCDIFKRQFILPYWPVNSEDFQRDIPLTLIYSDTNTHKYHHDWLKLYLVNKWPYSSGLPTSIQISSCLKIYITLTLSTLGNIYSRQQIRDIFLICPRKQDLTFHANCFQWGQFAWNVKFCFQGKIRKIFLICCLLH